MLNKLTGLRQLLWFLCCSSMAIYLKREKPKTTGEPKPRNWRFWVQKPKKPISKMTKTEKPNAPLMYVYFRRFARNDLFIFFQSDLSSFSIVCRLWHAWRRLWRLWWLWWLWIWHEPLWKPHEPIRNKFLCAACGRKQPSSISVNRIYCASIWICCHDARIHSLCNA